VSKELGRSFRFRFVQFPGETALLAGHCLFLDQFPFPRFAQLRLSEAQFFVHTFQFIGGDRILHAFDVRAQIAASRPVPYAVPLVLTNPFFC